MAKRILAGKMFIRLPPLLGYSPLTTGTAQWAWSTMLLDTPPMGDLRVPEIIRTSCREPEDCPRSSRSELLTPGLLAQHRKDGTPLYYLVGLCELALTAEAILQAPSTGTTCLQRSARPLPLVGMRRVSSRVVPAVGAIYARTPLEELFASLVQLFFVALAREVVLLEGILRQVKDLLGLVAVVIDVLLVAL